MKTNETETQLLFLRNIAGQVARWAVSQSPYDAPDDLALVVSSFCERVRSRFSNFGGLLLIEAITLAELSELVDENLKAIPEFCRWNLTRAEMNQGFTDPEDPERPVLFGVAGRGISPPEPDCDFIDLDALIGNVGVCGRKLVERTRIAWAVRRRRG